MKIILASSSPRRLEILTQLGIRFEVIPSNYREKTKDMQPEELAMHFAEGKAMSVAHNITEKALIIGADTIVYWYEIIGKPRDSKEAIKMLRKLSGKSHAVITGVSVISTPMLNKVTAYEKTMVKFKSLNEEEILSYVSTGEPMDKAGGYAIQGIGSLLVEKINGCYFNVMGLPVYRLSKMLETFGFKILGR